MRISLPQLTDINLKQKRVLIRQDLNVPMAQGDITSDARIKASLPTLRYALDQNAAVIVLSHLGRPEEGIYDPKFSLAPVARCVQQHLGQPVRLVKDWLNGIDVQAGEIVLCENVRMEIGEKHNDSSLALRIAQLADVFVMDAFSVAHRISASTVGVIQYANQVCTGLLFASELQHLSQALHAPKQPLVAVVGGSKVSTKLPLLTSLIKKVDSLILGGGLANTFLAAQGHAVGASLYEPSLIKEALELSRLAQVYACQLLLPEDVRVTEELTQPIPSIQKINAIQPKDCIFDIGPITAAHYSHHLKKAGTILWNGPMGIFEQPSFQKGTQSIANAIAESTAFSIAGGGDTLAAIEQFHITEKISYISTGGGAFLSFLEEKPLPVVQALSAKVFEKTG